MGLFLPLPYTWGESMLSSKTHSAQRRDVTNGEGGEEERERGREVERERE